MVSCAYCGDATGELAFECDYCGDSFCQSHRLPEAHECPNISAARPPTSAGREADAVTDWSRGANSVADIELEKLRERANTEDKPYSVVTVEQTVGTTPEPEYDSGPDVAVDGSIATEGDSGDQRVKEGEGTSNIRTGALVAAIVLALLLIVIGIVLL